MTSPIWYQTPELKFLNNRSKGTLPEYMEIEFTEVGDDYLLATMPVDNRTQQYMGLLHGGASCALGETVGSVAANFCIPSDHAAVGMEINANHVRAVKSGYVEARATPWHIGKSSQVWHIEIRDERRKLISIQRLTLSVILREKN